MLATADVFLSNYRQKVGLISSSTLARALEHRVTPCVTLAHTTRLRNVCIGDAPQALAQFGLDAETVARRYPRLVVCTLTGYGRVGPDKDVAGYDVGA
jgi:hypothetical protein